VLDDPSVSRYHARIEIQGRRVDVRDLDSTNGTRVNGREVPSSPLEVGDGIAFGSIEARLSLRKPTKWS
jgi:pSer/pThr/pTyr-binding forkhead associated (FHA) protein